MTDAFPAKVMVVEDEWLVAAVIVAALEDAYSIVGPVSRVDDALRLLAQERPDAALLDVNLDGKQSYEIADALRARDIPFAFMSGYAPRDLPVVYCETPLVQKPADAAALCQCVNALLGSH